MIQLADALTWAVFCICVTVLIVLFAGTPDIADGIRANLEHSCMLSPPPALPGENLIGGQQQ